MPEKRGGNGSVRRGTPDKGQAFRKPARHRGTRNPLTAAQEEKDGRLRIETLMARDWPTLLDPEGLLENNNKWDGLGKVWEDMTADRAVSGDEIK